MASARLPRFGVVLIFPAQYDGELEREWVPGRRYPTYVAARAACIRANAKLRREHPGGLAYADVLDYGQSRNAPALARNCR